MERSALTKKTIGLSGVEPTMAALGFEEACVKDAKGDSFSDQYARAREGHVKRVAI